MFLEQSFSLIDIPSLFTLTLLELLLSADNALVLGLIARKLPLEKRTPALFIGLFSAFLFRGLALFSLSLLLRSFWIQLLGSLYLIYLCARYFMRRGKSMQIEASLSFWKAVLLIECLDLVFAIDSILAGIAFIDGVHKKLWIVYFGGILGIIGMRYAAGAFSRAIEKFPSLEKSAYMIVGWIGIKLGFLAFSHPIPPYLFWPVIAISLFFGLYRKKD